MRKSTNMYTDNTAPLTSSYKRACLNKSIGGLHLNTPEVMVRNKCVTRVRVIICVWGEMLQSFRRKYLP